MSGIAKTILLLLFASAILDVAYAPLDGCLAPRMCRPVNRCCFPRDGNCPAGQVCCQMWRLL